MTEGTQTGKLIANMEYNTKLTEGIVQKLSGVDSDMKAIGRQISGIEVHLANLNGQVASHAKYLTNLDERIVEERKHREGIKENLASVSGATKVVATLWGTVASIVVGVATYFFTKG